MDHLPFTATMQSKLCDKTVVRIATDVFQYAKDCASREKASAFDVLIASLWMTYHGPYTAAVKHTNDDCKSKGAVVRMREVDRESPSNIDDKMGNHSVLSQENVRPEVEMKSTVSDREGGGVKVFEDNYQPSNVSESSTCTTVNVPIITKQPECDELNKTKVQSSKVGGKSLVRRRSSENCQSVSEEKTAELNKDSQTDSSEEVVQITKRVKLDSSILKEKDGNESKESDKIPDEAVKEHGKTEQDNLDQTITEPKELGMDCENDDNDADNAEDVTDDSMFDIQITNVTGGVDVMDSITDTDGNHVRIKTELPDGLIVELNEDDNDMLEEEEGGQTHAEEEMSVDTFDERTRSKRDTVNQDMDCMKTSMYALGSNIEVTHGSNLKPVMMMSNVHNSQDARASHTIAQIDARFGPLVSVQTTSGQQQFVADHQGMLLDTSQTFPQATIPQKQQVNLLSHPHQQRGLTPILPKGSQVVHGGVQDQILLLQGSQINTKCSQLIHPTFSNVSSTFMTSLTKEAQSKFVAGNKVDFAALDSVVSQAKPSSTDDKKQTPSINLDVVKKEVELSEPCEGKSTEDEDPESSQRNKNTAKNTRWALSVFDDWRKYRHKDKIPEITCMDKSTLAYWLIYFVSEIKNKKGEDYPPRSLYIILCGLLRYMRESGIYDKNFLDKRDPAFTDFYNSLDSKMRDLLGKGLGLEVKQADPISAKDEDKLWNMGVFGMKDAKTLQLTIFFYSSKFFRLRGRDAHRNLRCEQFQVGEDAKGRFVSYIGRNWRTFKCKLGQVAPFINRDIKHYCEPGPRCMVNYFEVYLKALGYTGEFYRRVLRAPTIRYGNTPVGVNALNKFMKEIAELGNLKGNYTNLSGIRTCAASGSKNKTENDESDEQERVKLKDKQTV